MTRLGLALLMAAGFFVTVSAQDQAAIDKGMKVFADQKCSLCHAVDGKGNARGALDGVGSRLSADEIRQWITDPRTMTEKTKAERKPAMRAYPNLAKADLDALVAYLTSLKQK